MDTITTITEASMTLGADYAGEDVAGWYVTEKFNGVRAYWDGATLWTRGGKAIAAAAWLTADLPAGMHLDCELWCGYGTLGQASAASRFGRFPQTARLIVHDAPGAIGDYSARMRQAAAAVSDSRVVRVAEVGTVADTADLYRRFEAVRARGGEGLMIRNPAVDTYEHGRTLNLLKVKHHA